MDGIIRGQVQAARSARYELEWKVYGHDQPDCLGERLAAAGFEAGARETFMVFFANDASRDAFGAANADIRRVTDRDGLRDYQIIREEVSGRSCTREVERHASVLENHPNSMSVYVAYVDAEPAACGRVYFHVDSKFAGLYGGSTREGFRKRGLFTQLVAARIREAVSRGIANICVDALPTSEPILRKRGFESVTYTQPFTFPQ
ncbi:MAG: GNAT family N-acetyltransferase [Akkermansiaceae bacterium]|nr:GNAT family N-acetyltransferase [Armatimonadota bacterium]